jgi:hypothetical protein
MLAKPRTWLALLAGASTVALIAAAPSFAANRNSGTSAPVACAGDVSVTVSPTTIWPPNHKFVPLTITATDTEGQNEVLPETGCFSVAVDSVTSDEEGPGQVTNGCGAPDPTQGLDEMWNPTPTVGDESSDGSVANKNAVVRAERCGGGTGRTYTITVTCVDEGIAVVNGTCTGGTTGMATLTVFVPHDQGTH